MAIKETPISAKTYYKLMQQTSKDNKNKAIELKEKLIDKVSIQHKDIMANKDLYLTKYSIDLDKYKEFKTNTYSTGTFLKVAKGAFINRANDYNSTSDLYDLYELAKCQKELFDTIKTIELNDKLIKLSLKEYTNILRIYYTEVHKQLILEGNGYVFGNNIGWICVNRCFNRYKKKMLDYSATKKKEKELKEAGKKIYNKDEEEWCLKHGIDYKAEDKRVFRVDEYCYEIPLLGCTLPNGSVLKLEISDYRHSSCRGITNDELINKCNNNTREICELPVDLRTKLTLCNKVDTILYTKFIRNENQKSHNYAKTSR